MIYNDKNIRYNLNLWPVTAVYFKNATIPPTLFTNLKIIYLVYGLHLCIVEIVRIKRNLFVTIVTYFIF